MQQLLDEVFGESCFIANAVWWSKYTIANDAKYLSKQHEYLTVYCKNIEKFKIGLLPRTDEMNDRYSNPDDDRRGDWKASPLTAKSGTDNSRYSMTFPNGVTWESQPGTYPRFSKEKLLEMYSDNRLYFGKDGKQSPASKTYLSEVKQGKTVGSIWKFDEVGSTHAANEELAEILGKGVFQNPKPSTLIRRCFQIATNKDSIVLDSFAGSGTTAHAVLDLNREDGGTRKFILIEQEDYADKKTAERVRRVIAKNDAEKRGRDDAEKKKAPLLAKQSESKDVETPMPTFSFFRLGDPIEMESILKGKSLPSYEDLARYVFYTATGEEFDEKKVNQKNEFIGESSKYRVHMLYEPDIEYLKRTALTLDWCRALPTWKAGDKHRLVFAPAKYVDDATCLEYGVDFCQLPYEIYRLQK